MHAVLNDAKLSLFWSTAVTVYNSTNTFKSPKPASKRHLELTVGTQCTQLMLTSRLANLFTKLVGAIKCLLTLGSASRLTSCVFVLSWLKRQHNVKNTNVLSSSTLANPSQLILQSEQPYNASMVR